METGAPGLSFPRATSSFRCNVAKLILPLGIGVGWGTADRACLSGKGVLCSRKPAAPTTDTLPMGLAFCGLLNPIPSSSWFVVLSAALCTLWAAKQRPPQPRTLCHVTSYLAQPFLTPYHRSPCGLPARRQSASLPLLLTSPSNSLISGGGGCFCLLHLPFFQSVLLKRMASAPIMLMSQLLLRP